MWEARPELHEFKGMPVFFMITLTFGISWSPLNSLTRWPIQNALLTLMLVPGATETIWMSPAMRHASMVINQEEYKEGIKFRNLLPAYSFSASASMETN